MVAKTVAEAVEDALADALTLEVGVGAIVRVTLKVVVKTLTIARVWEPEVVSEVEVKEEVSPITVVLALIADVEVVGEGDWAADESMREAYRRKERRTLERWTRASQGIRGGDMMMDVRRRNAHGNRWVSLEAKSASEHVRARLNLNLSYTKHLVEIKSAVLRAIQPCQAGFEAAGRARLNGTRASAGDSHAT